MPVLSRALLGAIAVFCFPALALAHPGDSVHGLAHGLADGFAHPFSGLDHVLAMVAVGMFAANLGGRALWAVPLTFMALMAVGGVVAVAGVPLPFVETAIAFSVIVLGVVVAMPRQWPLPVAMVLVGGFAVFHGYAHGSELKSSTAALDYGVGFLAATALLHLAGIAGAFVLRVDNVRAPLVARFAGVAIAVAGIGFLAGID